MSNDTTKNFQDQALFTTEIEPVPAKPPAPKRKKRRPSTEIARTPTGENAADIIAAWVDWYREGSGTAVPPTLIARMSKSVRGLIVSGYSTDQIKYGLAFWVIEEQNNPRISPDYLERLVWRYARDTSTRHTQWIEQMKQAVGAFTASRGVAGTISTAPTAREAEIERGLAAWLAEDDDKKG